jgi:hypothetical protein
MVYQFFNPLLLAEGEDVSNHLPGELSGGEAAEGGEGG